MALGTEAFLILRINTQFACPRNLLGGPHKRKYKFILRLIETLSVCLDNHAFESRIESITITVSCY
jgi:hypothetical protein